VLRSERTLAKAWLSPGDATTVEHALAMLEKFAGDGRILPCTVTGDGARMATFTPLGSKYLQGGSSEAKRSRREKGVILWHPRRGVYAPNPLLHEAVHAVLDAKYPRQSRAYQTAVDTGALQSREEAIALHRWGAFTEYEAYRIAITYEAGAGRYSLEGKTPEQKALESEAVKQHLEHLRRLGVKDPKPTRPRRY
jgi:hypothetical protein